MSKFTPDEGSPLAVVDVSVRYRGQSHRTVLRVTDSLSRAFIHSLLTEAVDQVRSSLNDDRNADYRQPGPPVSVGRQTDFPNEVPESVTLPGPPPGLSLVADPPLIPSGRPRDKSCRAVVLQPWADEEGGHARRVSCGWTLGPGDSCPNNAHHVGGGPHVKGRHFEADGDPNETTLSDLLGLVGVRVRPAQVVRWTAHQRANARAWAEAVHLNASDNLVVVPHRPEFLDAYVPASDQTTFAPGQIEPDDPETERSMSEKDGPNDPDVPSDIDDCDPEW